MLPAWQKEVGQLCVPLALLIPVSWTEYTRPPGAIGVERNVEKVKKVQASMAEVKECTFFTYPNTAQVASAKLAKAAW
jgi:hypothetical protein